MPHGRVVLAIWGAPEECAQQAIVQAVRDILPRPLGEDTSGHPAAGAYVRVYAGCNEVVAAVADGSGVATVTLNAGTYSVRIEDGAAARTFSGVAVTAGAVTTQTFDLQAGVLRAQAMLAPGHPAVGAYIHVYAGSNRGAQPSPVSRGAL
jgi:hypothetical protein